MPSLSDAATLHLRDLRDIFAKRTVKSVSEMFPNAFTEGIPYKPFKGPY